MFTMNFVHTWVAIKGFYNKSSHALTVVGFIGNVTLLITVVLCELELWLQLLWGRVISLCGYNYKLYNSELPCSVIRFTVYLFRYFIYPSVERGKMLLRPLCSYLKTIFSFQMRYTLCIKLKFKWYSMNPENSIQIVSPNWSGNYNKNANNHYSLPSSVTTSSVKLFSVQKTEFMIICTHH